MSATAVLERPTIRVVRDEAEQKFRAANHIIDEIRHSSRSPAVCFGPVSPENAQASSIEDTDLSSASFSQARSGAGIKEQRACEVAGATSAESQRLAQGSTVTPARPLRHASGIQNSRRSNDLRERFSNSHTHTNCPPSGPDLAHEYAYPQHLWRQRSTRPLTPTRSRALAYMSLSDAKPWPVERRIEPEVLPKIHEKDVGAEGLDAIARIREIEEQRALMVSVTDSMSVEVDDDESVEEDENERERERERRKLKKKRPTEVQEVQSGYPSGCAAKRFWRWCRGEQPPLVRSGSHEEVDRMIEEFGERWMPLDDEGVECDEGQEECQRDRNPDEHRDTWSPSDESPAPSLARCRPATRYRTTYPSRNRIRTGRFGIPREVRCLDAISERSEEDSPEDDEELDDLSDVESEPAEGDESPALEPEEAQREHAARYQTPFPLSRRRIRTGRFGIPREVRCLDAISEREEEDPSSSSVDDEDLDDSAEATPIQSAEAVPLRRIQLSEEKKAELQMLRNEAKRDSLEPLTPPPVPLHREENVREFQRERYELYLAEMEELEVRRGYDERRI